jgi:hypothetical protein
MANPEHLAILKQGVKKWNEWKREWDDRRALAGPVVSRAARAGIVAGLETLVSPALMTFSTYRGRT